MTVRMYAARNGWELDGVDVDARYDIDDAGRATIDRTITLPVDLAPEHRLRLADVAERTPVTLALRAGIPIATTVQPPNA
jgi:putative redox protein